MVLSNQDFALKALIGVKHGANQLTCLELVSVNFINFILLFCLDLLDVIYTLKLSGCSKKTIDIMFVLDGSNSVGLSNFDKVKIWTNKVARHFHEYDRKTQIGVVQYSHYNKYK